MEETLKKAVPCQESLSVGLLLAVVGGFLDTYTYLTRGGVFANAQTGNMVLLSICAAQGQWARAGYYLIPILAFALGVVVTEGIRARAPHRPGRHWQRTVLLLEAGILAVVGFLPAWVPHPVVNITISFLCSMQVNGFRLLEGMPYATTMCTGNLRSCSQHLWQYLFRGDREAGGRALRYLLVILVFCLGAAVSVPVTGLLGVRSVWLCALVLLGVWRRLLRGENKPRGD